MKAYVEILEVSTFVHSCIRWNEGDSFEVGQIRECQVAVGTRPRRIMCAHEANNFQADTGILVDGRHGRFRILSPLELLVLEVDKDDS